MSSSDDTGRRGPWKRTAGAGTGTTRRIAGGLPRSLPVEQAKAATLDGLAVAPVAGCALALASAGRRGSPIRQETRP
jgi:hypothetical protein